jgi:hypothetical protein
MVLCTPIRYFDQSNKAIRRAVPRYFEAPNEMNIEALLR